jgi:mRNA interferase RelE/StbE
MAYRVMIHPDARKVLDRLPEDRQRKLLEALRRLAKDPLTPRPRMDIRKIKGPAGKRDVYRLRVGDYRVLYDVDKDTVWVTEIFHRGRGYP